MPCNHLLHVDDSAVGFVHGPQQLGVLQGGFRHTSIHRLQCRHTRRLEVTRGTAQAGLLQPGGAGLGWQPGDGGDAAAQGQQGQPGWHAGLHHVQPRPPLQVERPGIHPRRWVLLQQRGGVLELLQHVQAGEVRVGARVRLGAARRQGRHHLAPRRLQRPRYRRLVACLHPCQQPPHLYLPAVVGRQLAVSGAAGGQVHPQRCPLPQPPRRRHPAGCQLCTHRIWRLEGPTSDLGQQALQVPHLQQAPQIPPLAARQPAAARHHLLCGTTATVAPRSRDGSGGGSCCRRVGSRRVSCEIDDAIRLGGCGAGRCGGSRRCIVLEHLLVEGQRLGPGAGLLGGQAGVGGAWSPRPQPYQPRQPVRLFQTAVHLLQKGDLMILVGGAGQRGNVEAAAMLGAHVCLVMHQRPRMCAHVPGCSCQQLLGDAI
mmetsp:Transcript_17231/g.51564  ORF Transcript_17231/g.51564 Transcript_17231/m.51564 type:complete len:427 (-) Transcript_17231:5347-6627(-)